MNKLLALVLIAASALVAQTSAPTAVSQSDRLLTTVVPTINTNFSNLYKYGGRSVTSLPSTCTGQYEIVNLVSGSSLTRYLNVSTTSTCSWVQQTAPAGGSTTQVQFNNAGSFGGDSTFTFDPTTKRLSLSGNFLNPTSGHQFGTSITGVTNGSGVGNLVYVGAQSDGTSSVFSIIGAAEFIGSSSNGFSNIAVRGRASTSALSTGNLTGSQGLSSFFGSIGHAGSGVVSSANVFAAGSPSNTGIGSITDFSFFKTSGFSTTTGTITNGYHFYAGAATTAAGTLTNNYAFYAKAQNLGVNKYSFYAEADRAYFGGQTNSPLVTPASSSSACVAGDRQADAGYIYVCTATNTWKRAALSAF
jgi:hypothetical protein